MVARRTQRRWRTVVGLVGPTDVAALQQRVAHYRQMLEDSIAAAAKAGTQLPTDSSQYSQKAWVDQVARASAFEQESTSNINPFAYLYAGAAYDRGRVLIQELDGWRDELARLKAPNVPAPIPVPQSDLGIAGGMGFALAALVAILALRELR
jgi:hypothetical protein